MVDKLTFSLFFFIVFVLWMGLLSILKPEFMVRTTATNTLKKKPTKAQIKRYKISGYAWMIVGITLIIITFLGGFKGI